MSIPTLLLLSFRLSVPQAMASLSEQGAGPTPQRRLRLGGLVLDNSVRHFRNSTEMEFVVTDLATELLVRYRGALPDLFREGHSVVVEGFLRRGEVEEPGEAIPGQLAAADPSISKQTGLGMEGQTAGGERVAGCYFAATEVLAKHDEVGRLIAFVCWISWERGLWLGFLSSVAGCFFMTKGVVAKPREA